LCLSSDGLGVPAEDSTHHQIHRNNCRWSLPIGSLNLQTSRALHNVFVRCDAHLRAEGNTSGPLF